MARAGKVHLYGCSEKITQLRLVQSVLLASTFWCLSMPYICEVGPPADHQSPSAMAWSLAHAGSVDQSGAHAFSAGVAFAAACPALLPTPLQHVQPTPAPLPYMAGTCWLTCLTPFQCKPKLCSLFCTTHVTAHAGHHVSTACLLSDTLRHTSYATCMYIQDCRCSACYALTHQVHAHSDMHQL